MWGDIMESFLDTDIYQFHMLNAFNQLYPDVRLKFKFVNRGTQRFSGTFLKELNDRIHSMLNIRLTRDEKNYLRGLELYPESFLDYLDTVYFEPKRINLSLTDDNDLFLEYEGGKEVVLWETPLLAMISELYFTVIDRNWEDNSFEKRTYSKFNTLTENSCNFIEFGTRRRRNYTVQKKANDIAIYFPSYKGTSNPHIARLMGTPAKGTVAHLWTQAISVLESMNHANRYALLKWFEVYKGKLGVGLTDTFGTNAYLEDLDAFLVRLYDGHRQDSGNPYHWMVLLAMTLRNFKVDPRSKTPFYTDSLNTEKCISIKNKNDDVGLGSPMFGIGTNITNDFPDSPPLNIVIKLWSVNGINTCKLSDDHGKETGDSLAVDIMKKIYRGA
jgi:nicotinate phosphoribosyltransferase